MGQSNGRMPFVKYDADGRLDEDLPCVRCHYNLRSMLDDGQCPECGANVYESVRLAWLCQHDPVWLRKLAGSTVWIGIAMACFVLVLLFVLWVNLRDPPGWVHVLGPTMLAIGSVAGLIGFWQITSPHRGNRIRQVRVRRVARWMMAAGLSGLLMLTLFDPSASSHHWLVLLIPCSFVCVGVGAWAILTHAATLAAKIPEASLVRQAKIVAWGFGLCFLFLCALFVLIRGQEQLVPESRDAILMPILGIACGGLIVLSIWTIPLSFWYGRRFREAAAMAETQQPPRRDATALQ